ncbi:MAG: hypothetical protein VX871_04615, partial [Pseudomonadota bacterium]|nr:hypothetical protein [Pseudomonadota bacterium]
MLLDEIIIRFRDLLPETERFDRSQQAAYQKKLLQPLLLHAARNVPAQASRLGPVLRGEKVDMRRWSEIPVMNRGDAQRLGAQLHALEMPRHAGKVSEEVTSGSTGRPLRHLVNELLTVATLGLTDRMYRWWNVDGNRTLATFTSRRRELAPPPDGTSSRQWRSGYPSGV